jgi:Zn-finger nucleic acid-binding protein
MKCPVDKSPLMVVERHQIELDFCPICRGTWFDEEELHFLAEALELPVDIPEIETFPIITTSEKIRRSPRTHRKMDKINMGTQNDPVVVDRDPKGYGLWFDGGELGKMLQSLKRSDQNPSRKIFEFLGETFHL